MKNTKNKQSSGFMFNDDLQDCRSSLYDKHIESQIKSQSIEIERIRSKKRKSKEW